MPKKTPQIIDGAAAAVHVEGDRFTFKVAPGNRIKIGTITPLITLEGRTFRSTENADEEKAGVFVHGGEVGHFTEAEVRGILASNPHALVPTDKKSRELWADCKVFVTGTGTRIPMRKAMAMLRGEDYMILKPGVTQARFDARRGVGTAIEHDPMDGRRSRTPGEAHFGGD